MIFRNSVQEGGHWLARVLGGENKENRRKARSGWVKRPAHKYLVHCCHPETPLTLFLCWCSWASDPRPFSAHCRKGGECFAFVFLKMDFFPLILAKLWLAIKFYVENHSFWSHGTIIFQNPVLLLKTLCLYYFDSYSLEVIFSITTNSPCGPGNF